MNCLVDGPEEVRVTKSIIHPGYLQSGPANQPDIAVLHLERPVGEGSAFIASKRPPRDWETLTLVGYGLTNNRLDTGEPRAGNTAFIANATPLMGYSRTLYDSTTSSAAPSPQLGGYFGDSGGPVLGIEARKDSFGNTEKRMVVLGHMVTATFSGGGTDYLEYTSSAAREFLFANMKVVLPELSISAADGWVVISWTSNGYNVVLKRSDDLAQWSVVDQKPMVEGARHTVILPSEGHGLFRLEHIP